MNWQQALTDYLLYINIERGLSKNTIASYHNDLKKLVSFLKKNDIDEKPTTIGN